MNFTKFLIKVSLLRFAAMSTSLKFFLEKNTLVESNYQDWLRNIQLVFSLKKISYVLTDPTPVKPKEGASKQEVEDYNVLAQDFE